MRKPLWSALVLGALLGCARPTASTGGATSTAAPLRLTPSPAPRDELELSGVEVQGHTLLASVMHGGGCKEHTYELLWNGTFQKAADGAARAELVLAHDAHGDRCEALLKRSPSFDLTPLQQRWREQNLGEHGTVELRFAGSTATARYAF